MSDGNDELLSYELGDDLDDQELVGDVGDEDALLLSDEEAQLDFEEDLVPAKTFEPKPAAQPVPDVHGATKVDQLEDEVKIKAHEVSGKVEIRNVVQPEPSKTEAHCQSTAEATGVDNDEDRVSSTNECAEPEHFPASLESTTEGSSPRKGAIERDYDYSSYDNDDEPSGARERYNPKTTSERDQQMGQQNVQENQNHPDFRRNQNFRGRGGRGGGPPFRGGRGFARGGFGNNHNNMQGPPQNNQFYPNENFSPMNNNGMDFGHPGAGGGPNQMMGPNRMPGPAPMMNRPQGGPPGMHHPDYRHQNPNMMQQGGNFGRPPFPNDIRSQQQRPMMRPPYDMPNQQPPRFGGPMNSFRPHHGGMPDQMGHGGGPYQGGGGGHFNPNFNRMHGPQQFAAPQAMGGGPYPQQQQPQRPPMMNRAPMPMGGGGVVGPPGVVGPHRMPMMVGNSGPGGMPPGVVPSGVGGVVGAVPVGGPIAPMLPRKVLINPNFKGGGVEAATNQLMKDTLSNPQLMTAMSDEALLRQQEEFINKNRMHIEKQRRHDRSPEPSRKRDYSPPPHRDRRYASRRGHSPGHRDTAGRLSPKRRRSLDGGGAPSAVSPPDPDEDEETKAYRLKIEKQKAMREKIFRDKEMRRRKAAERKDAAQLQSDQAAAAAAAVASAGEAKEAERSGSPKRLKPLVVTQKKIILLKNNRTAGESSAGEEQREERKRVVVRRGVTGGSSSGGASAVKPVVIKRTLNNDSDDDEDEFDEDELLAESPPPAQHTRSLTPPTPPVIGGVTRRIVLTGGGRGAAKAAASAAGAEKPKGIFDRLEQRVGVNEAAKRKLKRIVIKNLE